MVCSENNKELIFLMVNSGKVWIVHEGRCLCFIGIRERRGHGSVSMASDWESGRGEGCFYFIIMRGEHSLASAS